MSKAVSEIDTPKWDAVMLICKQCGTRKNGPDDLKPKALAKRARAHLKGERPRPRVLLTNCLGVCPTGAVAVAWIGGGSTPRIVSIDDREAFDQALPRLIPVGTPPRPM